MNKQHSKYTFKGHGNAITSLAFSPDGKRLVSSGYDDRTILWDLETTKVLNALPMGLWGFDRLSLNTSRVATAKGVWDIASGEVIRRHRRWGILAYSPDGRLLVSCKRTWNPETCDETLDEITIFDSQTGRKKHTIIDGSAPFSVQLEKSFVFSQDGAYLAFLKEAPPQMEIKDGRRTSIIGDKTVCVYELKTKSLVEMSRSVSYAELLWIGSPSHERLVALGYLGSTVWDAETGELLQEIHKYPYGQNSATLSPDGRLLAIGTEDGVAAVYSVSDARLLWKKRCHLSWVRTLAFTSDSCKLASAGSDHSILIHDAETGELLQTLTGRIPDVEALSFAPDGKHISVLYDDDSARLWSVEARSLEKYEGAGRGFLGLMRSKTSQIARHYWNPALKDLLASIQDSPLWRLQAISFDGTLVSLVMGGCGYFVCGSDLQADAEEANAPAPNPAPPLPSSLEEVLHKHLHNTSGKEWMKMIAMMAILSTESRSIRSLVPIAEPLGCVLFPDNRRCAVAHEKQVAIYSLETGKVLQQFETDFIHAAELTLSNDGDLLAAEYGYMGHLIVWDVQTGKQLDTEHIQAIDGLDIAFLPDGDTVITSCPYFKEASIRHLSRKGKSIHLEGHLGSVRGVACSPDGKLVATGAQDGAVKVWDAMSGALLATYQALPEAEAWVVHTPEGEVTGSPGAEAYLMENIERER